MYTFAIQTNRRGAGVAERGSLLGVPYGYRGFNPFLRRKRLAFCKSVSFGKVSGYNVIAPALEQEVQFRSSVFYIRTTTKVFFILLIFNLLN